MEANIIRQKFLDYFKEQAHQIVPSAPIVLKNDPTLLFTNSGMVQFKDFFLGNGVPSSSRVADTQKCLRVSGKHNDLEEVGIDTYHHTMFEMLGNWSFGDYFKEDAIKWAWKLLTEEFKLPKERLYVSVFGGDQSENLAFDQEAFDIWRNYVSEDRIINGSKKDNFWEMGDMGPCGPCSEIHIDLRPQSEIDRIPGRERVNNDDPQVIEIWNLVFMQFNRLANGKLEPLPNKHVDTGMGFERLVRAIQNKSSNYDTDVFQPLIQYIASASGLKYGDGNEQTDIAMRVMADHIRAVAFTTADGQLPANNGAGYVIRRILRRAVRYGYTFLGFKEPFMHKLVHVLANQMEFVFPELKQQEDFVAKVVFEEETSFLKTLDRGLKIINEEIKKSSTKQISGLIAFELYDTFGFPLDLTQLIARENGFEVDVDGFNVEMQKQKDRSRNAAVTETGDWILVNDDEKVEFVGYDEVESQSQIIKYREVKGKGKNQIQMVLNRTPFYAESGGQVGDTGFIEANGEKTSILDTKKENDLTVHFVDKLPKDLKATFKCVVNVRNRRLTENNHSATHLLHSALRKVLGDHVHQKGSLVNNEVLRFDFSHFAKMTDEEIKEVESIVNQKIRENIALDEKRNVPIDQAKALGAMALFGEKYGDFVRVITFDKNYSVELCGGTHVKATGQIGLFKIVAESSVAAGVRRIEAFTAESAEKYVNEQIQLLNELKELLKNPKDLVKSIQGVLEEKNQLLKEIEAINLQQAAQIKDGLLGKVKIQNGVSVIIEKVSLPDADSLKNIAFQLKQSLGSLFLVLAADVKGSPQVAVMLSDDLVARGLNAGNMVRELAKEIKGGGGGQPFFATAGGKDLTGLDAVVKKANELGVSSL